MTETENIALPVSRGLILLCAVAAGIAVANIYYNQPILQLVSNTFHVSSARAGVISILSQVGYGLGLFFLTPLGDKVRKKKLILVLQSLLFLSLVFITIAGSIEQVWVASVLISMFSVSVQVIIPLVAGLDSRNRGKNVGTVFAGLLIGILGARVFSGLVAEWLGWRYVFAISAMLTLLLSLLLQLFLPDAKVHFQGNYISLLGSALKQIVRFRALRYISAIGALQFGLFSSFWTTLTFHLSGAPFFFKSDRIGLFGLVAICGALMAPYIGRLADKGSHSRVRFIALGLVLLSIGLMITCPLNVAVLVVAVLLLDVGAQSIQVTNTTLIYSLDDTSYSRINTIYMTSFFTGGALGTVAGIVAWQYAGWLGVNLQMLLWALVELFLMYREKRIKSKDQIQ